MSRVTFLVALAALASLLVLAACGATAPTQVPEFEMSQAQPPEASPFRRRRPSLPRKPRPEKKRRRRSCIEPGPKNPAR